jgi:LytS/YehU family sensor histidine kinase
MLVENAIKHGISNLIDGGTIAIKCQSDSSKIKILVENTGKLNTEVDLGIGIQNLRRRLAIQFDDQAEFSLTEKNNIVSSLITLTKAN